VEALRWIVPGSLAPAANGPAADGSVQLRGWGRHEVTEVRAWIREIEELSDGDLAGRRRGLRMRLEAQWAQQTQKDEFEFWETRSWDRLISKPYPDLPLVSVTPFSHRVERVQVQALSKLAEQGSRAIVVQALRMFDEDIQDVEIVDPTGQQSRLRVSHGTLGMAPISTFGDGMRRTLALALGILGARGGVFNIDEIETAVHVKVLDRVFQWLVKLARQNDVQIFATTHSLEAVDAILSVAEGDDLSIYHLRREEGRILAHHYDLANVRVLRESRGLDIR
jgi:hypothetical protein